MKAKKFSIFFTTVLFLLIGFATNSAIAETFKVNPTSSFRIIDYLTDTSADSTKVDLSEYGFAVGDVLEFEVTIPDPGFSFANFTCDPNAVANATWPMTGVFSTSGEIGPVSEHHRVYGAINVGISYITGNTWRQDLETDIPQDFNLYQTPSIEVPADATFLILSAQDSLMYDNCVVGNKDEDPEYLRGYVEVTITATRTMIVDIDVKPGSYPNCFNNNGHGVIPVAILGSEQFDVTQVVYEELSFGGMAVRVRGKKGPLCHLEDSNSDGYTDLVCQFEDDAVYWEPGDSEATLTGKLSGGGEFEGTDSICVVQ